MYYSAHNSYASDTDLGFSNTWEVWGWDSKKSRDAYLTQCRDLASRGIKKKEIGRYLPDPRPFSGEAFRLNPMDSYNDDMPAGFLGKVETSSDGWSRIF
jgi:hypothetical protein